MALVSVSIVFALVSMACKSSQVFIASHAQGTNSQLSLSARQQAIEKAINECPQGAGLYSELAALLIARRDFPAALTWIDKGLNASPESLALRYQKAATLLSLGRPDKVLSLLDRDTGAEANYYIGLAHRSLQNHTIARAALLRAWQLGYRSDYLLYSTIEEDYALGDKQGGLERFQSLLKTYPKSPWVHLLLADAYFAKEQNNEARVEYLKALESKPDIVGANFRLGYLAFQAVDREAAAQYFRREIGLNAGYVDAHVFLAESLLQLDRKSEAVAELHAAIKLDQTSDLPYKRLATTLIEMNRLKEAAALLSDAQQRFPKEPAFSAQLARVFTMLGRNADAKEEAVRARRLTADQHHAQELAPVK